MMDVKCYKSTLIALRFIMLYPELNLQGFSILRGLFGKGQDFKGPIWQRADWFSTLF